LLGESVIMDIQGSSERKAALQLIGTLRTDVACEDLAQHCGYL
jgi:hypothetical protein